MNQVNVAIIGAGMAGARCARLLADAGFAVTVFDKSRGVGGRMATRRTNWAREGVTMPTAFFDHGVPAWDVGISAEFDAWALQAKAAGVLQRWDVRWLRGTVERRPSWLATPDMPALCRWMLQGIPVCAERQVDALVRAEDGWRLQVGGSTGDPVFDTVVVAIPPAQAAALLEPHQPRWAQGAKAAVMQPCWTLMGISDRPASWAHGEPDWDVMEPPDSRVSLLVRQDAKPGRQGATGHALWVAHTHPDWTLAHLEHSADDVRPILQDAVSNLLGPSAPRWHHVAVHRWRYAQSGSSAAVDDGFQWDPSARLGTCGDHWGGGGVVGAWQSGSHMARVLIHGTGQNAT